MEIGPEGEELFHADGQTDRNDGTNSRFPHFCKGFYNTKFLEIWLTVTWHTIPSSSSPA